MSKDKELPRLFHIGTQRAGSTYLYNLLQSHPQVSLSNITEVSYYSRRYDKGPDWYLNTFKDKENKVMIDTSPSYFINGDIAAQRIKDSVGESEPKFLLILRNPIDYLNSHFRMHLLHGFFKHNRDKYPKLTDNLVEFIKLYPEYAGRGRYAEIYEEYWLRNFRREQTKVVFFEDFIRKEQSVVSDILDFWGLDKAVLTAGKVSKNKPARNSLIHKIGARVARYGGLKSRLKRSKSFNYVYDNYLTKDSSKALVSTDRSFLSEIYQDDVEKLSSIVDTQAPWSDFK